MPINIEKIKNKDNIINLLDDQELSEIGINVVRGYEIDEASRASWKAIVNKALELANQKMEEKTFPWRGAANIKFPLITQAAINFASRTMPEIIQNVDVVKALVNGDDTDDQAIYQRSTDVSRCMSFQLLVQSPDWEEGVDSLLHILPIVGTVFKKVYYSEIEKRIICEVCTPDKIIVNYNIKSLETARRITQIFILYKNDIIERQRRGLFRDDIDDLDSLRGVIPVISDFTGQDLNHSMQNMEDSDPPFTFLEQHCWLDLDEDGYHEPYIVTVHLESKQVFRIQPCVKSIEKDGNKISRIIRHNYFVDYHFIRSNDGGFYSIGFGALLLPLNKAINTLHNQLINSGTLASQHGGLIGSGIQIQNGTLQIQPGEFKQVRMTSNATSINNLVYEFPFREPSKVLYDLLVMLIQVGHDLASTTDILQGNQAAHNVATQTVDMMIQQGTKTLTAINKRVYRSQTKEYQIIKYLNYVYLTDKEYANILNKPGANVKKDFDPSTLDIYPIADPTLSTEQQKLTKMSVIQSLRSIDVREADKMMLETLKVDKALINRLLPDQSNQPPPPEAQKIMAEIQLMQAQIASISADATLKAGDGKVNMLKVQQEMQESMSRINESIARVWKIQKDAAHNDDKTQITAVKMQSEQELKVASLQQKAAVDKRAGELAETELLNKIQHENNINEADLVHRMNMDTMDKLMQNKELELKKEELKVKKKEKKTNANKP